MGCCSCTLDYCNCAGNTQLKLQFNAKNIAKKQLMDKRKLVKRDAHTPANYSSPDDTDSDDTDYDEEKTIISAVSNLNKSYNKLVDNCLVIFLGIKIYPKNINNLNDIRNDYLYLKRSFKEEYGYTFISNDFYKPFNEDDVKQYFQHNRDKILLNDNNVNYNGLIICCCGHGSDHHLLCSDGRKLSFKWIRSIFSSVVNIKLQYIPKIFIINCCRSSDNDQNIRTATTGIGYSATVFGTTEGNYVFGSQLSKCVADSFSKHKDDKQANFRMICKYAANKLDKQSNHQQGLILTEHDIKIDDVIFVKNEQKRPARFEPTDNNLDELDFIVPKSYYNQPIIDLDRLPSDSEKQRLSKMKLKLNDMIILNDKRRCILKYVGIGPLNKFIFGVELLDNHKGEHNGKINGKYYFNCGNGKGLFVTAQNISRKA